MGDPSASGLPSEHGSELREGHSSTIHPSDTDDQRARPGFDDAVRTAFGLAAVGGTGSTCGPSPASGCGDCSLAPGAVMALNLILLVAGPPAVDAAEVDEPGVLSIPVTRSPQETIPSLRRGDEGAWDTVSETAVKLSRTPPLYEGDPLDDGARPRARVAIVRTDSLLLLRIRWSDPVADEPAEPIRRPDGGDPSIYKAHSRDLVTFADAVCVMLPRRRGRHGSYPSQMMGERGAPVDLFYWSSERGFRRLNAHGRATTAPGEEAPKGAVLRGDEEWSVVFELKGIDPHTPIAFAVWDGGRDQRDGLKYFTPWYEVDG